MSRRETVDAMDLQRQMVMELLGSVSGELKHDQPIKTTEDKSEEMDDEFADPYAECDNMNEEKEVENKVESELHNKDKSARESIEEMLRRAKKYTDDKRNISVDKPSMNAHTGALPTTASFDLNNVDRFLDYDKYFNEYEGYTKGCKWSPDGNFLLSLSSENKYYLFPMNETIRSYSSGVGDVSHSDVMDSLREPQYFSEGELSYDYQWYPQMDSNDPSTCCFISTSRGMPIHLWNITTQSITHSYRPFNHLDELAPSYSLGFSRDGHTIVCGFKKAIRYFKTSRPGRDSTDICAKKQNGVISCFDFHPQMHHIFAAGGYLGNIGLYNLNTNKCFSILDGQGGGVTQVLFSDDGYRLYSGARMDNELLCWDIRNMGAVLASYKRNVTTNQRIYFTLTADQNYLISGGTDGSILAWDLKGSECLSGCPVDPTTSVDMNTRCINGVSIHPTERIIAASHGQRGDCSDTCNSTTGTVSLLRW